MLSSLIVGVVDTIENGDAIDLVNPRYCVPKKRYVAFGSTTRGGRKGMSCNTPANADGKRRVARAASSAKVEDVLPDCLTKTISEDTFLAKGDVKSAGLQGDLLDNVGIVKGRT